jgi:hypothetical protein
MLERRTPELAAETKDIRRKHPVSCGISISGSKASS